MRERRDRFRLALEAGARVGIGSHGLREDLNRHVPVQLLIPRAVDLSHPTRAQRGEDLEGAEAGAGDEGQCVVEYTSRMVAQRGWSALTPIWRRRVDAR
jgi:hypothetical protein